MIFLTSDEHYFHKNISKYCGRPFTTVEEMNFHLIDQHNKRVTEKDEVYHLGDFTFCDYKIAISVVEQLNGTHYFIRGNHDAWLKENSKIFNHPIMDKKIKWIKSYHELNRNNTKIILFHYPMISWNASYHGSLHLYGHCHSTIEKFIKGKQMDIGVDNAKLLLGDYKPFALEECIDILNGRDKRSILNSIDENIGDDRVE